MKITLRAMGGVLALVALGSPLTAQMAETAVRDEILDQFERSSQKIAALAEAMPADLYAWAPGEGVMSVARVYAHIARYNFMYLSENLGIDAPPGMDWQSLEEWTDKGAIRHALEVSVGHVRRSVAGMTPADLTRETTLYGRRVQSWAVLVQLVSHMNEHVGQSVAYARMNGVVPPWSR